MHDNASRAYGTANRPSPPPPPDVPSPSPSPPPPPPPRRSALSHRPPGRSALANYTVVYVNGTLYRQNGSPHRHHAATRTSSTGPRSPPTPRRSPASSAATHEATAVTGSPTLTTTPATPAPHRSTPQSERFASANYSFSSFPAPCTIGQATLTVTAANASRAYGTANPGLLRLRHRSPPRRYLHLHRVHHRHLPPRRSAPYPIVPLGRLRRQPRQLHPSSTSTEPSPSARLSSPSPCRQPEHHLRGRAPHLHRDDHRLPQRRRHPGHTAVTGAAARADHPPPPPRSTPIAPTRSTPPSERSLPRTYSFSFRSRHPHHQWTGHPHRHRGQRLREPTARPTRPSPRLRHRSPPRRYLHLPPEVRTTATTTPRRSAPTPSFRSPPAAPASPTTPSSTSTEPSPSARPSPPSPPSNQNIIYGAALPTYTTATITGFLNGDTQATAVTGAAALSTTPATPVNAGRPPPDQRRNRNARFRELLASPSFPAPSPSDRPPSPSTAANASRAYGTANPTFSASATGALPGDTFTFTESTTATTASPVGTYPDRSPGPCRPP